MITFASECYGILMNRAKLQRVVGTGRLNFGIDLLKKLHLNLFLFVYSLLFLK